MEDGMKRLLLLSAVALSIAACSRPSPVDDQVANAAPPVPAAVVAKPADPCATGVSTDPNVTCDRPAQDPSRDQGFEDDQPSAQAQFEAAHPDSDHCKAAADFYDWVSSQGLVRSKEDGTRVTYRDNSGHELVVDESANEVCYVAANG